MVLVGIAVGIQPKAMTFLDCGLRRNDGKGFRASSLPKARPRPSSHSTIRRSRVRRNDGIGARGEAAKGPWLLVQEAYEHLVAQEQAGFGQLQLSPVVLQEAIPD